MRTVDAVVIGAGPNGLVAANALVDAGWEVLLLEAAEQVGGAVRTAEVTAPGFRNDLFSAFYPLAAGSPVIRDLGLEHYGLRWVAAPDVLAHPTRDGRCALLSTSVQRTAANLETFAPGDGEAWARLFGQWRRIRDDVVDALFTPFPPLRALSRLLRKLGPGPVLDLARFSVTPVRRFGEETFSGEGGRLLLTGNAMHSDVPPDGAGSGIFGWLLAMLGQDFGFPVPEGGAQSLPDALRRRLEAKGATVETGVRVTGIQLRDGTATGVNTEAGETVLARHGVLADVDAPTLYRSLVGEERLPAGLREALARFQWDNPTLKLNWALSGPVPWRNPEAHKAGTVHLGVDLDDFVDFSADLSVGRMPRRPFILFGQMTTSDPTRSPAGTESAWAYTHVPAAVSDDREALSRHGDLVEAAIEEKAPGFRDRILARHVQYPNDLEAADSNLVNGAINAGTSNLHQQLVFRPVPGLGRPETPFARLYLAGASAHPGGGVHGACGWNAARSALGAAGRTGAIRRALAGSVWERLLVPAAGQLRARPSAR